MDGVRDPQALEEAGKGSSDGAQRAPCSDKEAQHSLSAAGSSDENLHVSPVSFSYANIFFAPFCWPCSLSLFAFLNISM